MFDWLLGDKKQRAEKKDWKLLHKGKINYDEYMKRKREREK